MIPGSIDYAIVDGICSYCGRGAESDEYKMSYCPACDSYNDDLEMGIDDDTLLIIPTDDDNLNVYF